MKIIVAGAGEVGSHLAKMLSAEFHDITVIDPDEESLKDMVEAALQKSRIDADDGFEAVSG